MFHVKHLEQTEKIATKFYVFHVKQFQFVVILHKRYGKILSNLGINLVIYHKIYKILEIVVAIW